MGRTAIWRTRAAYLEGGLEYALRDVERPGQPKRYRAPEEAQVTALACSSPPPGRQALDRSVAHPGGASPPADAPDQPREHPPAAKKNLLKPWRKLMWCIGKLTEEYRRRMYDVLELYARPYREREPVICIDEKSKQLIRDSRAPLPMKARGARQATITNTFARAPATCSWRSNPKAGVGWSRLPSAEPSRISSASYSNCLSAPMPPPERFTWFWTTSTRISARASRRCSAQRPPPLLRRVRVSPHAQARELVEHGGDRDQHPGSPMPRATIDGPSDRAARGQCLATPTQRRTTRHRLDVYSPGCRSKTASPLCFVINVFETWHSEHDESRPNSDDPGAAIMRSTTSVCSMAWMSRSAGMLSAR